MKIACFITVSGRPAEEDAIVLAVRKVSDINDGPMRRLIGANSLATLDGRDREEISSSD